MVKMKRKLISLFLITALTLTLLPAAAFGASASDYSADKALTYAKKHWNDGKGDCVAFARACVQAGGIPKEKGRTYGYSVKEYKDYLVKNGFAEVNKLSTDRYYADYEGISAERSEGLISRGDIILYHCNNKKCPKPDFHMAICNGADGTNEGKYPGWMTCYAHNKAVNNKVACKIKCSRCGASANSTTLYAIHFKSKDNGYPSYVGKVKGMKASAKNYHQISLKWNAMDDADSYVVYRSTAKSGKYTRVAKTTEPSYVDEVTSVGKTYYYKVKAYQAVNGKDYLGEFSAAVSAKTKLRAPALKKEVTAEKTILSWSKVDGADGYQIYRAAKKKGTYKLVRTVNTGGEEGTPITESFARGAKGKIYYYKVKAFRSQAGSRVYSAYSTPVKSE